MSRLAELFFDHLTWLRKRSDLQEAGDDPEDRCRRGALAASKNWPVDRARLVDHHADPRGVTPV
jgi:hypothetical protein